MSQGFGLVCSCLGLWVGRQDRLRLSQDVVQIGGWSTNAVFEITIELESPELAHKLEWWALSIFQNSTGKDVSKSKIVCLGFPENSKLEKLGCL